MVAGGAGAREHRRGAAGRASGTGRAGRRRVGSRPPAGPSAAWRDGRRGPSASSLLDGRGRHLPLPLAPRTVLDRRVTATVASTRRHGAAAPRGRPAGPRPARLSLAGAAAGVDDRLPPGPGRPARGHVDLRAAHRDLRPRDPERGRRGLHARPRAGPRHRRDAASARPSASRGWTARGLDPATPWWVESGATDFASGAGRLGGGVRGVPARRHRPQPRGRPARRPPPRRSSPASAGPARTPGRAAPEPAARPWRSARILSVRWAGHRVVVVELEGEAAPAARQRAQVDGVAQQLGGGHQGHDELLAVAGRPRCPAPGPAGS